MGKFRPNRCQPSLKLFLALALFPGLIPLTPTTSAQEKPILCHVYIVDVLKARRSFENFRETGDRETDEQKLNVGQTLFPEFSPKLGEEELTNRTYRFPGSRLFITASVFFTDESMASWPTGDYTGNSNSLELGISLGPARRSSALDLPPFSAAVTEVTLDEYTNNVRTKQYVRVNGRAYLIGMQCDCMAGRRGK